MSREEHGLAQLRDAPEFVLYGDEDVCLVHAYNFQFYITKEKIAVSKGLLVSVLGRWQRESIWESGSSRSGKGRSKCDTYRRLHPTWVQARRL